ncbi:hypothetical protein [Helicobacter marmotae]|uniref:hypothetical protein n=1 Tax=Helicobacter marmotae TaxID=152490 RepID=UPI000CF14CB3|nr:hypothetical protein [Helicobacter marmotae]
MLLDLLATPLLCHSEPLGEESLLSTKDSLSKTPKGTTSDSDRDSSPLAGVQNDNLREPLIYKRDSSLDSQAQNDNKSDPQDKITLQGKLVCHSEHYGESLRKATRESLSYCHSEGAQGATEESLKESLVAKRDSSLDSQAQNDKPTTFTKIPKSNDSQKAHRDSSVATLPQNDNGMKSARNPSSNSSVAITPTSKG